MIEGGKVLMEASEEDEEEVAALAQRRPLIEHGWVRLTLPWLVIVCFFLVWEAGVRTFAVPEFVLPTPSAIFSASWQFHLAILENAWQTLFTTVLGFAIAIVFGLVAGVAIGSSTLLYAGFYPALIGFYSIPKVAIVPILVIWFGIGTVPAVITAFLISFFPILVNVATGIATLEPELRDVLRALGATRLQVMLKVGLPRAMPYFFASLKIAMTVAFVGSIVSETVAANKGIGHLMLVASSRFEVPLAFAALLVTGAMGVAMYVICGAFERRMTGWAVRGVDGVGLTPQG
jgi:NitT/TauT family transport system permease protein